MEDAVLEGGLSMRSMNAFSWDTDRFYELSWVWKCIRHSEAKAPRRYLADVCCHVLLSAG